MSLCLIIFDLMSNSLCCSSYDYSCVCLVIYCILHDFRGNVSYIPDIYCIPHHRHLDNQYPSRANNSHSTGLWLDQLELGLWVPVWSTIPEVSRACRELVKCCCKGDCSTCKCGQANLDCSPLCKCNCLNQ